MDKEWFSIASVVGAIMEPKEIRKVFSKVPHFGPKTIQAMLDAMDDHGMKICRKEPKR